MSNLSKLLCYFPADEPCLIVIKIESDCLLAELQRAIFVQLRDDHRQEVDIKDLRLYKTNIPVQPEDDLKTRTLQWLHNQADDTYLKFARLSTLFPTGPHPGNVLHIVISDAQDNLCDPYRVYSKHMKKDLNRILDKLSPQYSPSEIIHDPAKISQLLGSKDTRIHLDNVPAAIFNPALATLQRHLDDLQQIDVSPLDINLALTYLLQTVNFYMDETAREGSIKNAIDNAMRKDGDWGSTITWAGCIKPDCLWWHREFVTRILELKNTLGIDGDAILQAIIDYSKIIPREKYNQFRDVCNFPIVLVGITANRLEVCIAVCVGSIYVTRLLALDLSLGFHSSDNIIRLARVFKALSSCQLDLEEYYNGVTKLIHFSCLYPNPTCVSNTSTLPKLKYRYPLTRSGQPTSALLDLGNTTTAMYVATLNDTENEVIVKFTARYNKTAHRLLAEAGLAPNLHFCERVVGGLYMVVMDRVNGKSICELRQEKIPIPETALEKVWKAVRILHDSNIVFGDLRDQNILLLDSSEGSDQARIVLVDFDWAGTDKLTRYPATLNLQNEWAPDVQPYATMLKSHDDWQLERLNAFTGP